MIDFMVYSGVCVGYHMIVGVCILLKLKSIFHARYLVITTMLFCVLVILAQNNAAQVSDRSNDILFESIHALALHALASITIIANIIFFLKAMKAEKDNIIGAIIACMIRRGTKDERRKLQEEYFNFKPKK